MRPRAPVPTHWRFARAGTAEGEDQARSFRRAHAQPHAHERHDSAHPSICLLNGTPTSKSPRAFRDGCDGCPRAARLLPARRATPPDHAGKVDFVRKPNILPRYLDPLFTPSPPHPAEAQRASGAAQGLEAGPPGRPRSRGGRGYFGVIGPQHLPTRRQRAPRRHRRRTWTRRRSEDRR